MQTYSLKIHFTFFSSTLSERSHLENVLYLYNQPTPLTISLSDKILGVIFTLGFCTVLTCISWHCLTCISWHWQILCFTTEFRHYLHGSALHQPHMLGLASCKWIWRSSVRAERIMYGWVYLIAYNVNIHSLFWLIETGFFEVLKTLYMLMRNSVILDSKSFPHYNSK